jgi:hypothetical protein
VNIFVLWVDSITVYTGCFKKKYPLCFSEISHFRDTYGRNIHIITFHIPWTIILAITQDFTAHWEMKIKHMATPLNLGSIITNIYYFIQTSARTCLMFVPISNCCQSFALVHVLHEMIEKCIHVPPMYNSTASPAMLLSEMLII